MANGSIKITRVSERTLTKTALEARIDHVGLFNTPRIARNASGTRNPRKFAMFPKTSCCPTGIKIKLEAAANPHFQLGANRARTGKTMIIPRILTKWELIVVHTT